MEARTLSEWAQYLTSRGWPKEIVPLFASVEERLDLEATTFEDDEEEDEIEIEEEQLDEVDARMKYLGSSLNLLDPDGTFKGMPSEETLIKIMKAVREDYRALSDAILALRRGV